MNSVRTRRVVSMFAALCALALAGCGGGGGDDDGGNNGGNTAPTANAGADQSVLENTVVTLTGSASDPDAGDTITYAWTQTAGSPVVTINDASMPTANFTAPDVTVATPATLTFRLTVSDGMASRADEVNVLVQEPQPMVTVSGTVNYEFVPPLPTCSDLNFAATQVRPIRGATVQLLNAGGSVLQSTVSDDAGGYAFLNVVANTDVSIRVRAELKQAGSPSWDIEVRDNFIAGASDDDIPSPPPLATRALYVLQDAQFNTGSVDVTRDVVADSGWTGVSYGNARSAAPFAILDAIYSGVQLILSVDATANLAPMDAFWSVNNTIVAAGETPDITAGELPTAFYSGGLDSLFLRGDVNVNTDEFDDHVIMHEWGHYFEDNFSRSDSRGGPHSLGESLEARLAWGEGWASAFGAIALNDPLACDTRAVGSMSGFPFNLEGPNIGSAGWFNEVTVAQFVYDLWDTNIDGADNGSIGFGPIYQTMTGPQRTTESWTTVHSFAAALHSILAPADQAFLEAQMQAAGINSPDESSVDAFATTESNMGPASRDVIPVYTDYTAGDPAVELCVNNDLDNFVEGNKHGEWRYLRITVPVTDTYNVSITAVEDPTPTADPNDRDQTDPDVTIYDRGTPIIFGGTGRSGVENSETFTTPTMVAGRTYVMDLQDWRMEDSDAAPANYPDTSTDNTCFDVSFTP